MPPFDKEMTTPIVQELESNGVSLLFGLSAEAFEAVADGLIVHLKSGQRLPAQVVVLGIDVRPENKLAVAAGLEVGPVAVSGLTTIFRQVTRISTRSEMPSRSRISRRVTPPRCHWQVRRIDKVTSPPPISSDALNATGARKVQPLFQGLCLKLARRFVYLDNRLFCPRNQINPKLKHRAD